MSYLRSAILPGFLLLCLVLGGASAGGYIENLVLQLLAIMVIVWTLLARPSEPLSEQEKWLYLLSLCACILVVLQFVPLPHALWTHLPGRGSIAAASREAGIAVSPPFLTLMPYESVKSAVWMLPALAMLLAMLRLRRWHAAHLAWVIMVVMVVSVVIGALQISGGPASPWYFYGITNSGSTVGFFANSNHLATLLLISLPFLAALTSVQRRVRHPSARGVLFAFAAGLLAIALVGIFFDGSLMGYGLVLPVLVASALIFVPQSRRRGVVLLVMLTATVGGIGLVLGTDEGALLLDETSDIAGASRSVIFARSGSALREFWPAGAGLGSFAEIYRLFEDPALVTPKYVNHAHNDYIELLLETGFLGAVLLAAFLFWWSRCAIRIWTARSAGPFAQAAVIASGAVLAHSLVDYPLRTAAISVLFAACCAIMASARTSAEGAISAEKRNEDPSV